MQIMPIVVLTLIFLILNGFLWWERPTPNVWLFGSLAIGGAWGAVFLRLVTSGGGEKDP